MKIKKVYRHLFFALAALLFSFIVVFFTRYFMADFLVSYYAEDTPAISGESRSVLEGASLRAVRSTLEGYRITVGQEEDPQLYIDLAAGDVMALRVIEVLYAEPFEEETICVLYYKNEDGEYSGNCMITVPVAAGEDHVFFELPSEVDYEISEFRLDIDVDYTLADIVVSDGPLVRQYAFRAYYRRKAWAIYSVVLYLVFEGLWLMWNRCREMILQRLRIWKTACRKLLVLLAAVVLVNIAAIGLFLLTGVTWTWFWTVLLSVCSVLVVWQIRLLKRQTRMTASKKGDCLTDRKLLFWGCALVFVLLIVFEWWDSLADAAAPLWFHFPFAFAIVETVILALMCRSYIFGVPEAEISFSNIFLFTFILLGIGYLLVFLPDISPDESAHYLSAYRMANVFLGKIGKPGDNRLLMRAEDYALYAEMERVMTPDYYTKITGEYHLFARDTGLVIADGAMVTNALFSYIFSGLAIAISRIFHLSAIMTFHAGRLANLIVFAFVFRYLMKKIPSGRTALFAIVMMPMSLHLAASYSYDALTFCYVALFVVQVMCMILSPEKVTSKEFRLCILYGGLMAPSKLVYLPLLFLALLVPWEKLGSMPQEGMKKKLLLIGAGLASALVITVAVNLISSNAAVRTALGWSEVEPLAYQKDELHYTVSWIAGHPWMFFLICVRTVVDRVNHYFFTMIGNSFGYMDISNPNVYCVVSFLLFFLAVNIRDDVSAHVRLGWRKRLWLLLLITGCVFIILLAMALTWTGDMSEYIEGVQGRYFLPFLIPMIWICRNDLIRVDSVIRKHIVVAATALNVWILVYVFAKYVCVF